MGNSEIKIYKTPEGKTSIEVKLDKDTVWLSLNQMADLFQRDKSVISRHINNIFKEEELNRNSVVAKFATTASDGKIYQVEFFNLDVIISVGYRIKSPRGTQFRIWANQIIKDYLIKGYVIDQQRLQKQAGQLNDLKETIKILGNALEYKELTKVESKGLLKIISDYSYALEILDKYDYQTLEIEGTSGKEIYRLTYEEAKQQIELVKKTYGNSDLFGQEKDDSFKSSLATIYQTFEGADLYPSIEEKAAHLL